MDNLVDLHTHSVLSKHAYSSLTENIDSAIEAGLKYLGISEHQSDPIGVGAHIYAFSNLSIIPPVYKGLRILKGIEFNILNDTDLDIEDIDLRPLDFGIASIHGFCYKDDGFINNTENVLRAMNNPHVLVMGHLDRGFYSMDYEKIISEVHDHLSPYSYEHGCERRNHCVHRWRFQVQLGDRDKDCCTIQV